jgi:hypothetical protein
MLALYHDDELFAAFKEACSQSNRIDIKGIEQTFDDILKHSKETPRNNQTLRDSRGEKSSVQIFISYRHEEWASARTIYNDLTNHFGINNVFRDQDILVAGDDWKKIIEEHVASCSVFIALIGKYWVSAKSLRQLQKDDDWIHFEINTALHRNIRIIPVLLDGVKIPKAGELPTTLHALNQRQAIAINDSDFEEKIAKLLRAVGKHITSNQHISD